MLDVLVIDDGSPDGTADAVKKMQNTYQRLHLEQRSGKLGLGTAYIHGFKWALARLNYQYILEMDADFSHNPEDLPRLVNGCMKKADVAIGSRYVNGINVVNWPMKRLLMSYFASKYVRIVTGIDIKDATAGFKCYRRSALQKVPLNKIRFVGYAFQIEMKYTLSKYGFTIVEIPIIFTDRSEGISKMTTSIFREAFFGVIQMRLFSFFRSYR